MLHLLLSAWALVGWLGTTSPAPSAPPPDKAGPWFVQVVRGTDQAKLPENAARRIGPKLSGSLSRVFKWQHYYEVKQIEVPVVPGRVVSVPVGPDRELRIKFISAQDAELRLYRKGQLTRKDTAHLKNRMAILGGDEKDEGWFVVVRRDKPTTE